MFFSDKFVSAAKEYSTMENSVAAPYIRKKFFVESAHKAELTITGLGFYRVFINGTEITRGLLSPYISNSNDMVYYDNYDILPYLVDGENVIGVILGNGMQNSFGGFVWDFDKTPFRSAPMLALAVELDGIVALEADESFKTHPSPIIEDDLRLGEKYDARLEIADWSLPGFDDSLWKSVISVKSPAGEKRLCAVRPIKIRKEIKPVAIMAEDDGYVYDFGIDSTGIFRLSLSAKAGQEIKMLFGEVLKDGKFYWKNIGFIREEYKDMRPYRQGGTYVCKDGQNCYEPGFAYFGFRYVKICGVTKEQATTDLLTMLCCNTELVQNGSFECSDEVLNKIQEITVNSTITNFHHFPTDCPHREKNGWTADAALSAEQTMINFDSPVTNYKEWLRNICKAQAADGSLPGIIPTWGWGFEWGNGPAWDCVIMEIPYAVYKYSGDAEPIKICKDTIIKYLNYLETRKNEHGLLAIGLGDWCDTDEIDGKPQAPLALTDSIYSMHIARQAAEMMKVIGAAAESAYCTKFADEMRSNIRKHLLDFDNMTFAGNCQTSQAMGIFYGILEEDEREKAFQKLLALIEKRNYYISMGVLGLKVVFHVLAEFGRSDIAYRMITNEQRPSYGYWVKNGNTTLGENMTRIESENHHFMGDISAWFYKEVCGIQYSCFKNEDERICFSPKMMDKLEYASASFNTKDGIVGLRFENCGCFTKVEVSLPTHMSATMRLPDGWEDCLGRNIFKCGSGIYKIRHLMHD